MDKDKTQNPEYEFEQLIEQIRAHALERGIDPDKPESQAGRGADPDKPATPTEQSYNDAEAEYMALRAASGRGGAHINYATGAADPVSNYAHSSADPVSNYAHSAADPVSNYAHSAADPGYAHGAADSRLAEAHDYSRLAEAREYSRISDPHPAEAHEHSRISDIFNNIFHRKDRAGGSDSNTHVDSLNHNTHAGSYHNTRVADTHAVNTRAADTRATTAADKSMPTVAEELKVLVLKIVYVLVAFFIVFTFIFGLHRNLSVGMQPSLRDGDLLFYYRLDHNYKANNIVLFEYRDTLIASRVIAVEGDEVNISSKGLEINGHVMYEPEIYFETTQFQGGPTFPLTVEKDTVFVLGDNREKANDSRMIGLIDTKDIKGKVMGVIRRRNL